jgi:hypothetical protein
LVTEFLAADSRVQKILVTTIATKCANFIWKSNVGVEEAVAQRMLDERVKQEVAHRLEAEERKKADLIVRRKEHEAWMARAQPWFERFKQPIERWTTHLMHMWSTHWVGLGLCVMHEKKIDPWCKVIDDCDRYFAKYAWDEEIDSHMEDLANRCQLPELIRLIKRYPLERLGTGVDYTSHGFVGEFSHRDGQVTEISFCETEIDRFKNGHEIMERTDTESLPQLNGARPWKYVSPPQRPRIDTNKSGPLLDYLQACEAVTEAQVPDDDGKEKYNALVEASVGLKLADDTIPWSTFRARYHGFCINNALERDLFEDLSMSNLALHCIDKCHVDGREMVSGFAEVNNTSTRPPAQLQHPQGPEIPPGAHRLCSVLTNSGTFTYNTTRVASTTL